MASYRALGVMSGSSLDGLDLALCTFTLQDGRWSFTIDDARTVPYDADFRQRLLEVMSGSALDLARLNRDLGSFIGEACWEFCKSRPVDLVASHGHTIFHLPEEGLTKQIGCGARIAAITGLATVCDFRTIDTAFGGQGAPLVPMGERLLFPEHNAFLNLGGICNVALHAGGSVTGYDVCIGNQALDHLAHEAGLAYDEGGSLAASGTLDAALVNALEALPFHHQPPPRSLGREWFNAAVRPLIDDRTISLPSRLRSVVEHIALRTADALSLAKGPVLVTGGGAHNTFLLERIAQLAPVAVERPADDVVDFKEALVFALLGVLRLRGEANTLASVTGAQRDSIGGAVYLPN